MKDMISIFKKRWYIVLLDYLSFMGFIILFLLYIDNPSYVYLLVMVLFAMLSLSFNRLMLELLKHEKEGESE